MIKAPTIQLCHDTGYFEDLINLFIISAQTNLYLPLCPQTISVFMVAFNILYLLVDETAMPKGSTVSQLSYLNVCVHPHTHALALVNC